MYRLKELIQIDRKLFHTADLAVLWQISDRSHLYTTISRYLAKGLLYPVYKGLYSTVPISSLDPLTLGPALIHNYTYLSTETVLSQAGAISQTIYDYTYVSHLSRQVVVENWSFRFRQLQVKYLHHPAGISNQNGLFIASPERALADLLYFTPQYHLDIPAAVDLNKVKLLQQELGYL